MITTLTKKELDLIWDCLNAVEDSITQDENGKHYAESSNFFFNNVNKLTKSKLEKLMKKIISIQLGVKEQEVL